MLVQKYVNSIFNSNSYLIYTEKEKEVWVIDPGDSQPIIGWLNNNGKILKGILLTHSHFDHILGINDLQELFPEIVVYASFYAIEGMMSEKLNGSLYQEMPFTIKRQDIHILKEGNSMLLWQDISLIVYETPGHDRDCLSFLIGKNLFTGDALIPGIKVFTKLKYSDKTQAGNSIKRIFEQFDDDTMIWAGHENNCLLGDLKKITMNTMTNTFIKEK